MEVHLTRAHCGTSAVQAHVTVPSLPLRWGLPCWED